MVLNQDIQEKLNKHREEKAKQTTSEKRFSKEELDNISEIKSNYDAVPFLMW